MSLQTLKSPVAVSPPDTYVVDGALTENYTTTAPTVSGTVSLQTKITWPSVFDVTKPHFLVIHISLGAWSASAVGLTDTEAEWIAGMGGVHMEIETRVTGDDPLCTGDVSTHVALRRAIRAAYFDVDTALKYVLLTYLDGNGGTMPSIEPEWIFLMGQSAGGSAANLYSQWFPTRRIAGIIINASAYGKDLVGTTPDTATEIIRDQLKFRYAHHRVPTCAFLGGADTIVGVDRIAEFREHLGTMNGSIVHYDPDGGHLATFQTFDTTALTGASTVEEAMYNFIRDRCAILPSTLYLRQGGGVVWDRNWHRLQSRYW